ncbi:hypothetical protein, partial [Cupriavidus gilardii]|uniref:hypothetical protein n=1 Tax=Cupriavidus gilardii TaxID=82541 RepID=UPI0031D8E5A1
MDKEAVGMEQAEREAFEKWWFDSDSFEYGHTESAQSAWEAGRTALRAEHLAQQPAAQAAGLTECLNAHMSRFGPEPAGISAQRESDFVAGWNAAIAQAGLMEDDVARLSEELAGMLPSKRIHALRALLSRAAPSAQQAEPDG